MNSPSIVQAAGEALARVDGRLVISIRTADRHIQNIDKKTRVSTRGAAALFAIEHGILTTDA